MVFEVPGCDEKRKQVRQERLTLGKDEYETGKRLTLIKVNLKG